MQLCLRQLFSFADRVMHRLITSEPVKAVPPLAAAAEGVEADLKHDSADKL